jgi:hypothetical protein
MFRLGIPENVIFRNNTLKIYSEMYGLNTSKIIEFMGEI